MSVGLGYNEAVSRPIVTETCLDETEEISKNALITAEHTVTKKSYNCKKTGLLEKIPWSKIKPTQDEIDDRKDKRACYKRSQTGQIAKCCGMPSNCN